MIMKTWNDYKEHVRTVDPEIGKDIDEVENISSIVSAMVEQRTSLGLSQRELAAMCGIPQSCVHTDQSWKATRLEHCLIFFSISVYIAVHGSIWNILKATSLLNIRTCHHPALPKTSTKSSPRPSR